MTWFVEGLALIGLAGVFVPVILHFLGRPEPVERVFPAIQFLLRKRVAAARVYSLRELLILFLRMMVIVTGVLILARPEVPYRIPTCTVKGEINRDLVILLDNSPLSGYLPPEVPGERVSVFDLYRDLALRAVARVSSGYRVSLIPVDVQACATVPESFNHSEVAGALRAARRGDYARYREAFHIAHTTALQKTRSALLALTLSERGEWDRERVHIVHARPLSGMAPVRNRAIAGITTSCAGSPFARNEFFCALRSTTDEQEVSVLLEGQSGVLDRADVVVPASGTADAVLGFTPYGAGEKRLRVTLFPDDRLAYDNRRRLVFVSPGWPEVEWLKPDDRSRFRACVEAVKSFASGYGDGSEKACFLIIDGRDVENTNRVLSTIAEEVVRGAGLVVFLEALPAGLEDAKSLLPVKLRRRKAEEGAGADSARPVLADDFAARLSAAGITATETGVLLKVLSEAQVLPLEARPGTLRLAWKNDDPVGLVRPYGEGRVVIWNAGRVERLLARAPGVAVPLLAESMFLATDWRAQVRRGEVGEESRVGIGFRVGRTRITLRAPGEEIFRPLFVSSGGTEYPGFLPTRAGFYVMKVEDPTGRPAEYSVAVDAPPSPELAPLEELASPEQALEMLGEADRSRLSAPLCGLFLMLVILEVTAGNLLYRRVSRGG